MATKKMAILTLSMEALRQLIQLPADAELVRIEMAPGMRGVVNLLVEGVGWDTAEGMAICPSTAAICTVTDSVTMIDWGLPG